MENTSPSYLIAGNNVQLSLSDECHEFELDFLHVADKLGIVSRLSGVGASPGKTIKLVLEDVKGSGVPPIYKIYFNSFELSPQASEHYAGALALYGLEESSIPCLEHDGRGMKIILNVTELWGYLRSLSSWSDKKLKVTLMRKNSISAEASLTIGRASLILND